MDSSKKASQKVAVSFQRHFVMMPVFSVALDILVLYPSRPKLAEEWGKRERQLLGTRAGEQAVTLPPC